MTINTQENTIEPSEIQEKVNANSTQQIPDTNIAQQSNEEGVKQNENPDWKAFREARKKDRAEKEAAEKRAFEKEAEVTALKAAMEAAFAKSPPQQQQNYHYDGGYQQEETEDERIEKKVQAAIIQREAQRIKENQEREQKEYPNRLVQSYPDFNATISPENLDYLDFHYPEVSTPLKRQMDGFDKWSDIYKAVKKFVPNNTTAKREAARADANFAKPKSISSAGMTPSGEPMGSARISQEKRAENWARMQKTLKGVSS
jgi:parvulin-like peptidyl-prolyl isomerase